MPTALTRLDDPQAVEMTCGDRDPQAGHWEHAVFDCGRLTRAQVRRGARLGVRRGLLALQLPLPLPLPVRR